MNKTPLEIAREAYDRGWRVVPVKGKDARIAGKGWPNLQLNPHEQPDFFNGQSTGCGVVLGPSGLIDAEADCPASDHYLRMMAPETDCKWKSPSGREHRLYRCEDPAAKHTLSFEFGDHHLVELRGGNAQSVLPGSRHSELEGTYEWITDGEPAEIPYADIERQVRMAAAAGALAASWPRLGTRHNFALAVAGYLRRAGVEPEEARCILLAAASAAGDEEAPDRVEAAVSTYNSSSSTPTTGLPTIESIAGKKLAEWLHRHLPTVRSRGVSELPPLPMAAADDSVERDLSTAAQWPTSMSRAAFIGIAGEFVDLVSPHTEADEAALLVQFLVACGNAIGRNPHFKVGASIHTTNLNAVCVGPTGMGRKGTAFDEVMRIMCLALPKWSSNLVSGLSSGEGLINAVRDPVQKPVPTPGKPGEYEMVVVDEGVIDKRILVFEPEFSSVLKVATRDGNTLSTTIRQAWDDGNLRVLTRNNPLRATDAHISIIGHITKDDLRKHLHRTECANGFANRFLWIAARRSKVLPNGGSLSDTDIAVLANRLGEILKGTGQWGELRRDADADVLWSSVYAQFAYGQPGTWGAVVQRAAPQVMRLALIYAILDQSPCIRKQHLEAALEVWRYAEDSAAWVFGRDLGDPTAGTILIALREAEHGLSRNAIRALFAGHKSRDEISRALAELQSRGSARCETKSTGGRPEERWYAL